MNKRRKELRKTAHHYFDLLWLYKLYYSGKNVKYWRNKQYKWLSKKMNIPYEDCHMSSMNSTQCKEVIDLCTEQFAKNDRLMEFAEKYDAGKVMNWFKID